MFCGTASRSAAFTPCHYPHLGMSSLRETDPTSIGCLVVATASGLVVYTPAGRALEQRQREAAAQPQQAAVRFRLAEAP